MLSFDIARRYLLSRKSHSAVNIICGVAICGMAVAVMAIVVVLSVFNGFARMAEDQVGRFDADLTAVPAHGKTLAGADALCRRLAQMEGVETAVAVVEERALAVSGSAQMPVRAGFESVTAMDSIIIDGAYSADSIYGFAPANLAVGVAAYLGVRPTTGNVIGIFVPRRVGRINAANPATAFRGDSVAVMSVWQTERPDYDADRMIVPVAVARALLEYGADEASAIDMALAPGADPDAVAAAAQAAAGADVQVLTRARRNADSFRMIAVEKWMTFLLLVCILAVASFNIVSTLSLLVIEKRDNMATLRALGATRRTARAVFAWQGVLIALAGGVTGTVAGLALSLVQQHFGLVKLSADASALTVDVYPVEVHAADLLAVGAVVAAAAVVAALVTLIFTKDLDADSTVS